MITNPLTATNIQSIPGANQLPVDAFYPKTVRNNFSESLQPQIRELWQRSLRQIWLDSKLRIEAFYASLLKPLGVFKPDHPVVNNVPDFPVIRCVLRRVFHRVFALWIA